MNARVTTLGRLSDTGTDTEVGRAQARAATAYGAPHASYCVNGSTSANTIALRAHKRHAGRLKVLAGRGCHHSIVNEIIEIGGTITFLDGAVDRRFEEALPPRPDQVEEALARVGEIDVVVITSPTYAGFNGRVAEIAEVVHRHGALLHVDSAWGPLLGFHPTLPLSPAALGADTCSISVHKLAGAHSQGAVLTWSDRIDADAVVAAHLSYRTTSPSYVVAATIDDAIVKLQHRGGQAIERAIQLRDRLNDRLGELLPAVEVLDAAPGVSGRWAHLDPDGRLDQTRLTLGLARYRVTGFELSAALAERRIVAEKAGVETLTVFVALGATDDLPDRVASAIADHLAGHERDPDEPRGELLPDPLKGLANAPAIEPSEAVLLARKRGEKVAIEKAAGRVSLELVEAYPPGIPIGVPGFRFTDDGVAYLSAIREAGGHIAALDPEAKQVVVLREEQS